MYLARLSHNSFGGNQLRRHNLCQRRFSIFPRHLVDISCICHRDKKKWNTSNSNRPENDSTFFLLMEIYYFREIGPSC